MADNDEQPATITVPLSDFKRLLRALEHIVQRDQRQQAQNDDDTRRAARKAGPTTAEAEARVERRHKKWAGG